MNILYKEKLHTQLFTVYLLPLAPSLTTDAAVRALLADCMAPQRAVPGSTWQISSLLDKPYSMCICTDSSQTSIPKKETAMPCSDFGQWSISRSENGRPYFADHPEVCFSVSHSGTYMAVAFCGRPVGVDLQEHVTKKEEPPYKAAQRLKKIAQRFFNPLDAAYVCRPDISPDETINRFYNAWTAAESYAKCTGLGLSRTLGKTALLGGAGENIAPGSGWQCGGYSFFML